MAGSKGGLSPPLSPTSPSPGPRHPGYPGVTSAPRGQCAWAPTPRRSTPEVVQTQKTADSRSAPPAPGAARVPHGPLNPVTAPGEAQEPAVGLLASPPAAAQAEGFHLSRLGGRILPPPLCSCSQRKTLAGPLILLLPWDGWLPAACRLAWENSSELCRSRDL